MKQKDPAVLFFIDNFLVATAGMKGDCLGWYTRLLLHYYDKKALPNDIEVLASLAGVQFSEFERFKQVYEQVLKQKFKQNENGDLENENAKDILRAREEFKEKRSRSGNIGSVIKAAKSVGFKDEALDWLKQKLFKSSDEEIEEAKDKQVLKQMHKLYINGNGIGNKNTNVIIEGGEGGTIPNEGQMIGIVEKLSCEKAFEDFWEAYPKKTDKKDAEAQWKKLKTEEVEEVLTALPRFIEWWKTQDKQFLPSPRRFLYGRKWTDELIIENHTNGKSTNSGANGQRLQAGKGGGVGAASSGGAGRL